MIISCCQEYYWQWTYSACEKFLQIWRHFGRIQGPWVGEIEELRLISFPSLSHDNHYRQFAFIFGDRHKNDCMVVLRKRTRPQRALSAARRNALHWDTDGASKERSGRLDEGFGRGGWSRGLFQGLRCMPRGTGAAQTARGGAMIPSQPSLVLLPTHRSIRLCLPFSWFAAAAAVIIRISNLLSFASLLVSENPKNRDHLCTSTDQPLG